MAGDWIKVEKCTARKPEVLRVADILGIHPDHAFALCVRFWFWCDDNLTTGHAPSVTNVTLDSVFGHAGFVNSLIEVGWLRVREGSLEVPNFDRHLSESAKNRALSGERKRKQRVDSVTKMSRAQRDKSVTREEKRREEKKEYNSHTHSDGKPFVASEAKQERLRLPKDADTPRNREALELWQTARQQNNGHRTPAAVWEAEAMIHAEWSEETWFRSLQFSASKGSLGLLDPDNDFQKRKPQAKEKKSAVLSPEALDRFSQ